MIIHYGPMVLILFSILVGILMNRRDYNLLRDDMKSRFAELKVDLSRQFDRIDSRLDRIEDRLGRIDADLRNFLGTDKELEGRVNELSARIK